MARVNQGHWVLGRLQLALQIRYDIATVALNGTRQLAEVVATR